MSFIMNANKNKEIIMKKSKLITELTIDEFREQAILVINSENAINVVNK